MFPNNHPLPLLSLFNKSAAIKMEAIPAISLRDFTIGYTPNSSFIKSKAIAVILFFAKASKYSFFCVFNCKAEIKVL